MVKENTERERSFCTCSSLILHHHIENLQQQVDEQLVELADLREQLSHGKLVNETQEEYLNQLQKEIEDLIKTLKGQKNSEVNNA